MGLVSRSLCWKRGILLCRVGGEWNFCCTLMLLLATHTGHVFKKIINSIVMYSSKNVWQSSYLIQFCTRLLRAFPHCKTCQGSESDPRKYQIYKVLVESVNFVLTEKKDDKAFLLSKRFSFAVFIPKYALFWPNFLRHFPAHALHALDHGVTLNSMQEQNNRTTRANQSNLDYTYTKINY